MTWPPARGVRLRDGNAGKSGFRLYGRPRAGIIVAALAISVLVFTDGSRWPYDAHTARTTAHFLRQQLLLVGSLLIMVAAESTAAFTIFWPGRPIFGGANRRRLFIEQRPTAQPAWAPFQPALRGAEGRHGAVPRPAARRRQSKIDKIRIVPTWKFCSLSPVQRKKIWREGMPHSAAGRRFGNGDLSGAHFVGRAGVPGVGVMMLNRTRPFRER